MAKVSIVRVVDVETAVRQAVDLLGGMGRFVRVGDRVLIKVNMLVPGQHEPDKNTDPRVILAVAKLVKEAGGEATVADRQATIYGNLTSFPEISQYAQVVSLDDVEHQEMTIPGARSLRVPVPMPKIVSQCDVFINIPGMRVHALTRMSNALKNLMGMLPGNATFLCHLSGLEGSIVDLNSYRPSDLVITDAVVSCQGNFPREGDPLVTNLVTAADNVVAADMVAARLIGLVPEEVGHLREAAERGLGPRSLSQIEIVGEPLEEVAAGISFAMPPTEYEAFRDRFIIVDKAVCAACRQSLASGLLAASHWPHFDKLRDVTILIGHLEEEPPISTRNVVAVGNCTYRFRHLGVHVPGCPPLAGMTAAGLESLYTEPMKASVCSIAWRDQPIEEIVPRVANLGYDGIEVLGPHLEDYLARGGTLVALKAMLEQKGLAVPMVSPYLDFISSDQARAESLRAVARFADYARALGSPLVRVFTGGRLGSAQATSAQWHTCVEGLQEAAKLARQRGVTLALETHQLNLMDTTESTLRLLRQVGSPHLKVNLDIHNLFAIGENPLVALERLFPYVVHVHAKNALPDRDKLTYGAPLAAGDMNYEPFLRGLKAKGYHGYISIEWFGEKAWEAAAHELAYLRQFA